MRLRSSFAVAVAATLAVAGCGSDDTGDGTTDAGATITSYIAAYNESDLEAVMTHFTEDSVIVGHPTDLDPQAADLLSIQRLHGEDLRFDQQYVITNVLVDGDSVTWDSIWGDDGCVKGHSAIVKDGTILEWTWGDFVDCSEIG